jgi:hypothetical protein
MPRRRPGAVRAKQAAVELHCPIKGLSAKTKVAIARFEQRRLWAGDVAEALRAYRSFLRQPGRWLQAEAIDCPCCDPLQARDDLQAVLAALPRPARDELKRIVSPLDDDFLRRTVPDPFRQRGHGPYADGWWRHRILER